MTYDLLRQWMASLTELLSAADGCSARSDMCDRAAELGRTLLAVDKCALMLIEEGADRLVVAGTGGLTAPYRESLTSTAPLLLSPAGGIDRSPAVRAHLTGEIVTVNDISASSEFTPWRSIAAREGYRGLVAAPVSRGGISYGALVGYTSAPLNFTPVKHSLILMLTDVLALMLQMYDERASRLDRIDRLTQFNQQLESRQAVNAELNRRQEELMDLMAHNTGLAGVVESLADVLSAHAVLEDRSGAVLVAVSASGAGNGSWLDRTSEMTHKALERVLAGQRGACVIEQEAGTGYAACVAPVVVGGEPVALLWVTVPNNPDVGISDLELRTIDRYALAVSLELAKERAMLAESLQAGGTIISQLLEYRDSPSRSASLAARAASVGLDLSTNYRVVAARIAPSQATPQALSRLQETALRITAHSTPALVGSHEGLAVLLVPDGPRKPARSITARLEAAIARNPLIPPTQFIIGGVAREIVDFRPRFLEISGAFRLIPEERSERIVDLGGIGLARVLLMTSRPDDLIAFSDRALEPLRALPTERSAEILLTLRTWISNDCSPKITAERLFVHVNTVNYRLRTVEQLLARSLKSTEVVSELWLALLIADVIGHSQPETARAVDDGKRGNPIVPHG